MQMSTDEYKALSEAVLASRFFAEMIRAIHDKGHFIDPQTGAILAKGSPQLLVKFEEALSVLETRCAAGMQVLGRGGVH